jgi:hypothetical protein
MSALDGTDRITLTPGQRYPLSNGPTLETIKQFVQKQDAHADEDNRTDVDPVPMMFTLHGSNGLPSQVEVLVSGINDHGGNYRKVTIYGLCELMAVAIKYHPFSRSGHFKY